MTAPNVTAPNYAYARRVPAKLLRRGDHVEFQGRWWLVDGADAGHQLVSVTMREHACAPDQTMTQFRLLTVVWARGPREHVDYVLAANRDWAATLNGNAAVRDAAKALARSERRIARAAA